MTDRSVRPWRVRHRRRIGLRPSDRRGSHAWARRLLAERMDGPLPPASLALLGEHLRGCTRCRTVARAHEEARRELRAMRPTVLPRDLGARVGAALDREVTGRGTGPWRLPGGMGRAGAAWAGPVAAGAAAVAILVVGARLLLAPGPGGTGIVVRDSPGGGAGDVGAADHAGTGATRPRPTPFAVPGAELALVERGEDGLTVYRTAVSEVCPSTAADCIMTRRLAVAAVDIGEGLVPRGLAVDPASRRLALLAEDTMGADSVSVVTLPPVAQADEPRTAGPGPDGRWPATPATSGGPPGLSSSAFASPAPDGTPDPAGPVDRVRILAILEGVEAVGAAPAWSSDGAMLAFSAMPIDHGRGPDIYLWRPGDERARRLTADHRSWFASWSGARIVLSRMPRGEGREHADTVLLDPLAGTEVGAPIRGAWLPSVDPSGRYAVAWRGTLAGGLAAIRPRSGGLALIDWAMVDPTAGRPLPDGRGESGADAGRAGRLRDARSPWLEAVEPATGEGPAALDWQVRWANANDTFGYWVADAPGASWGRLTVLRVVPETRAIDRSTVLLGPTLARRSFTLGDDRVAWIAPAEEGAHGELRVRVWGAPGEGGLRLRDVDLQDGVPAF